ncbi:zinc-binding alcohol dehydrogenase family protein [Archangium violaceum]|uniref:quinone oxidoreductase family protein n=1 Tax=Archangium violaceum TaxID=83451 RepID=UPI00193BA43A|nr:zinc-binding alcohol dehydrogenase family protein [Archangium violaceum]QRK12671.1 zinc-binding alcohol dehydrogenase family protein [Archangium violaceum]
MKTMKALRFDKYGPPSVLSLREVAVPDLGPGEVLVELHAAAINPSDVKIVSGAFNSSLPRVPGRDFAGVVVAGDERMKGKEVWGSGAGFGVVRDGAHAQYVVLPSDWLSEKPANMTMPHAAGVGAPYVTAWSALVVAANVQAGETVLITGALGAVGRAATQIAHWRKARVIGAGTSERANDADAFINTTHKDLPTEVKALTGGKGVDVVLDAVGGPVFEPALKSLGLDGRQVVITSVGGKRVEFDLTDFYHNRQRLLGVDTAKLSGAEIAKIMDGLRAGFEEGKLQPPTVKTWSLAQATEAYEAVAKGDASAKHVLLPHAT